MRRNLLPRHYPVLTHIASNDQKQSDKAQLFCETENRPPTPQTATFAMMIGRRRSEFIHATVEDDLIGPGHVRSRSRSRARNAQRSCGTSNNSALSSSSSSGGGGDGQRSSSKPSSMTASMVVRPGVEIHLPQRGRYIVVEDVRNNNSNDSKRCTTPEFVLVNKENGRAVPLHSLYQNPVRMSGSTRFSPTPTDPPVDYDRPLHQQAHRRQQRLHHVSSMSDDCMSEARHNEQAKGVTLTPCSPPTYPASLTIRYLHFTCEC